MHSTRENGGNLELDSHFCARRREVVLIEPFRRARAARCCTSRMPSGPRQTCQQNGSIAGAHRLALKKQNADEYNDTGGKSAVHKGQFHHLCS